MGNPPFAGKNNIFETSGEAYVYYLIDTVKGAHGSSDLVAYFFRVAFLLLRNSGVFGFIATNTVAQGDTRNTGILWICNNGGVIFNAIRRLKWHGIASVVVSVIHIQKIPSHTLLQLDNRRVSKITGFLFHKGGNENPFTLLRNKNKSFIGSYVLGSGFTFDDDNPKANSLDKMREITKEDSRYLQRILPYLGGEDLNSSPTQDFKRYVIHLSDLSLEEAENWPALLSIVQARVKPERDKLGDNGDATRRKLNWWKWGQYAHNLFDSLTGRDRVIVIARISKSFAFTFSDAKVIFNEKIVVFPDDSYFLFSCVQCRVHEAWVRFLSSTMKDDLNYSPSDCFETFPFPEKLELSDRLEIAGKSYYEFRTGLMLQNSEGLTKTYNRFHDPAEKSSDFLKLRELHAAMDRAVLDAYGWQNIQPEYDFRPQLDESIRFTWSEDTRDEVLALLLERNRQIAEAEALQQAAQEAAERAAQPPKPARGRKKKPDDGSPPSNPTLPGFS